MSPRGAGATSGAAVLGTFGARGGAGLLTLQLGAATAGASNRTAGSALAASSAAASVSNCGNQQRLQAQTRQPGRPRAFWWNIRCDGGVWSYCPR